VPRFPGTPDGGRSVLRCCVFVPACVPAPRRREAALHVSLWRRCGAHRACCPRPEGNPCPRMGPLRPLNRSPGASRTGLPHPECGSRNHRYNYFILVITRVEAGDRAPFRCSGAEWGCWPAVGWGTCPVVDMWTTRPPCTSIVGRPRSVPAPPPACPQSMPRSIEPVTALAAR
jgi:hypothetical protein